MVTPMLGGRKILLGITGSIAAYKAAVLVRLLIKAGAEVKVVMTPAACDFITPLTLSTLSKNPVLTGFIADDNKEEGIWNNHVDLGLWADMILIAPVTANELAKMANGICDNLLTAVYFSARCPVYFAPAMDLDMYRHPATKDNIKKLESYGNNFIKPAKGELASGLYGEGRMQEPEKILEFILAELGANLPLSGKNVLITAGPTYEPIDPVRFIGNYSSGRMGFALAEEASRLGAKVYLVTGPVALETPVGNITRINVKTAEEMYSACDRYFKDSDIAVMSAAVADYRPAAFAGQKIKREKEVPVIELTKTRDIIKELTKKKSANQLMVGFALETDNELKNAKKKLKNKELDMVVLNSLKTKGAGFGHATNKVSIIDVHNKWKHYELKSKREVARDIFKHIQDLVKD